MAADDRGSTDKRHAGARPASIAAPKPAVSSPSGAPASRDPQRLPRAVDEAIARLSGQHRAPGPAPVPDKKFRFDFRNHRSPNAAENDDAHDDAAMSSETPAALDAAVAGMEALQKAIDRRWAVAASAPETAETAPAETVDTQLEAIRQRLAELAGGGGARIDAALRHQERPQSPQARQPAEAQEGRRAFGMSVIENHLARLAGEVAMLAQRRAPADPELLSRIAELRDLVAANNAAPEIERLEHQLAAVIQRIEALFAAMARPENFADIARRIDAVSKRLDELAALQGRPIPALDHLMREIALVRREIATQSQRPDGALEAQIAALAGRIDAIGQNAGGPGLARLETAIAAMAARLDERPIPPRAEAIERHAERPSPPVAANAESLLIKALKEDLLRLQAGRTAATPQERAPPQPAEAPRKVDRPSPSDDSTRQGSRRAVEPRVEDHRPLEPGSGRPASGRKAEFVAAARRAAVVAATESEMAPPAARRHPQAAAAGMANMFRGRRAAMALAAGVVALGIAAVPILLLNGNRDRDMLARAPALSPAEESVVALEDLPEGKTEARLAAPLQTPMAAVAPPPEIDVNPLAPADSRFTLRDPAAPVGPATKDASRPSVVSPDVTATTPAFAGRPADLFPESTAPLQPAPHPPEAIGPERLRNAAAAGDPAALFEVGARYAEGRGVAASASEAAKWYRLAAERGLAIAQFRIASLHERGEGVAQDRNAAADWYRRAAEQGNVRAMHNLAVMLSEGVGGPPDFGEAARWFSKGADHGVRDSQYNLGVMYARGLGGEQDLVQSYKWFAIAAQQGDPDAGARRDEVAKVLTPDQLAQAQAAVRAWRAIEPPAGTNLPPPADDTWSGPAGPVSALDRQGLVRLIQQKLTERGFDPGPPDGETGPKTRDAVIAFQREQGVPATGEIGPELLAALDLTAR